MVMATKSIIKNIEISDPAEAEKLVKALEEAKKICRRTGRRTNRNGGKPMKENCSNCYREACGYDFCHGEGICPEFEKGKPPKETEKESEVEHGD
jgi:hypothetical protein